MGSHSRELIEQARQLPVLERIEVVDALLAAIDEAEAEIDHLWAEEAEARLAAYRRGEIESVDMEEVLAKYRLEPLATRGRESIESDPIDLPLISRRELENLELHQ